MLIRAKAPLRIGFAGGGTDVAPYCDIFGGSVTNACINVYAYATIEPRTDGIIEFRCEDQHKYFDCKMEKELLLDGNFSLQKGVYNRIVKDYINEPLSFTLTTYINAPVGSGLGSSSSLCVAILKAFLEWKNIPLSKYEIANLAWEIERKDLQMVGGKQDQFAATFGGFNFMEFNKDLVTVSPIDIKNEYINELEFNTILYYTGVSRVSSKIIQTQVDSVNNKNVSAIDAMHKLKQNSIDMKDALLKGQLDRMGELLNVGWKNKKEMSSSISNSLIDEIYNAAINAGATGGKISGAGGGGFFIFYCPENTRYKVIDALSKFGGEFRRFKFSYTGVESWKV